MDKSRQFGSYPQVGGCGLFRAFARSYPHGMTDFDAFIASMADPMSILAGFDRQAALRAGIKPGSVNEWNTLHSVYFGPTRFSKKQRKAVEIARETKKTFDQLTLIEKSVQKISDSTDKWDLRLALLSVRGNYETLKRKSRDIVPDRDDRPAPQPTVRFTGSRKRTRTVSVTGDEHTIAALEHALRRNLKADRPAGPQMYEAFIDLIKGDGNGVGGVCGSPDGAHRSRDPHEDSCRTRRRRHPGTVGRHHNDRSRVPRQCPRRRAWGGHLPPRGRCS